MPRFGAVDRSVRLDLLRQQMQQRPIAGVLRLRPLHQPVTGRAAFRLHACDASAGSGLLSARLIALRTLLGNCDQSAIFSSGSRCLPLRNAAQSAFASCSASTSTANSRTNCCSSGGIASNTSRFTFAPLIGLAACRRVITSVCVVASASLSPSVGITNVCIAMYLNDADWALLVALSPLSIASP